MKKALYKKKWKTVICPQGSKCWCRGAETVDGEEVAPYGWTQKEIITYLVKLHNRSLK